MRGFGRELVTLPSPGPLAPALLPREGMRHPNAAIKEAAMAKVDFCKMCLTVMALGAVMFLTHSAFLAFAR
jgi:hypothetical protein